MHATYNDDNENLDCQCELLFGIFRLSVYLTSNLFCSLFFIFSSLSVSASDLISRLVRGEVCRSEQIQSHPFFKGVNWNEVSCTQFSYTESSGPLVSGCTPKMITRLPKSPRTLDTRWHEYSRFTPIR